ncbi:sugar ABC transporter ATP-binding protein [Aestuariivirga sp.]|uniref:sugar ABC transporter ATP-binding protein n=1 Tax=Aestuariivirga sp. TaxID=2650926 RepID=UPI0039E2FA8B
MAGPATSQAPAATERPLLAIDGLCKSFFGVEVLHKVSFSVRAGRVLGLVGENGSGKSTTMNIIGGVHQKDAGSIQFEGADYRPKGPRDAARQGIAFIHQELNLFRNLSIAENLFITEFPKLVPGLPFIDKAAANKRAAELLAAVDLDLSPSTLVNRLSQGERQLVEIAKALGAKAKVIIFDEPTTSLTTRETDRLFDIINRLRSQGIAIIYISHILNDVMRLCDDIVVLRDGHVVGSALKSEMTIERMISLMVGRNIDQLFPPRADNLVRDEAVLEVSGISQPGIVKDITFSLQAGEVLGISGLMGAGRSELARILFGIDPFSAGQIKVAGETLESPTPSVCMDHGMAFLTEDRRVEGLMMEAPIETNIGLSSLRNYAGGLAGVIDGSRLNADVKKMSTSVQISAKDIARTLVKNLSGGNQQKAVIGKWLLREPRVFILDEPTRGIDVGAKNEVYKIINSLAAAGAGILMISSEIEELAGMCDRIMVMAHGEIRATFARGGFKREEILRAAMWDGLRSSAS